MRLRPSGAPVLVAAMLALCICMSANAEAQLGPLRSVGDYLTAFDDAYQPDPYQAALLHQAEAAVHQAERTMQPDVTFEQNLDWSGYRQLNLDVEAGLRLPLYDSRATPSLALAGVDRETARATAEEARRAARLTYFVDVATYAALAETADAVAVVSRQADGLPWLSTPDFEPLTLAPEERGLYESVTRLLDMHSFLLDQRAVVVRRIALAANLTPELLSAPPWTEMPTAVPPPPDSGRCLASSPAAAAAHLRFRQTNLYEALEATAPFTVDLTSDLAVTLLGPGPTGGSVLQFSPAATLALEARLALPSGRATGHDADGSLGATLSSAGASQSLRVSWPRRAQTVGVAADPDADLAAELEAAAVNLAALRRAVTQSASERNRLERALDWLLLDSLGFARGQGQLATALTPAAMLTALSGVAPLELLVHVADLSAQLTFAKLDELIATAQLASDCGVWP